MRHLYFRTPLCLALLIALPSLSWAQATPAATPTVSASSADKPLELRLTASFFTRLEVREDYAALGLREGRIAESDFVRYRARLGLATSAVEIAPGRTMTLRFVPQASGFWADKANTLSDGAMGLHEAAIRLTDSNLALGDFWLEVGRFEMTYGEHLLIGNVDWHETGRSFDGLRAHLPLSQRGAWLDGFATQVLEDPMRVKPLGAGDLYFAGLYAGLGPLLSESLELDTYLLSKLWPKVGGMSGTNFRSELTVGGRAKTRVGALDLRGEAGAQFSLGDADRRAYQGEAEVGGHPAKSLRIAAAGWLASGDDPQTSRNEAWDQLFPTAHKFMGFADIMGARSNIAGGVARTRYTGFAKTPIGSDFHLFWRPEVPSGTQHYTGMELDTWAMRWLGKGLGLRAGYSLFVPNQVGAFASGRRAHYVEVQLRYDLRAVP